MKKLFFVIIALVVLLFVIALFSGLYLKFMPDKNYSKAKADYTMPAFKLFKEFENNEAQANKKYMDRIIEVSGNLADISEDQKGAKVVTIRGKSAFSGVLCTLNENETKALSNYKINEPIKIRGVCTGMLMDVVLNKCVIVE